MTWAPGPHFNIKTSFQVWGFHYKDDTYNHSRAFIVGIYILARQHPCYWNDPRSNWSHAVENLFSYNQMSYSELKSYYQKTVLAVYKILVIYLFWKWVNIKSNVYYGSEPDKANQYIHKPWLLIGFSWDNESTLVQVMLWSCQETCHYLKKPFPKYI